MTARLPLLSIVTPAYNEELNLPMLFGEIKKTMEQVQDSYDWEWIIVDDHSRDGTFAVICELAKADARIHGVRLAKNCGSHQALTCGLKEVIGDCAVILASDLQDPPSVIPQLLKEREAGAQIVWAVRKERLGETASTLAFSRIYYWLMAKFVGIKLPPNGADFFLVERNVVQAFLQFKENNVSVHLLFASMGFRQTHIDYTKEARVHGVSGWTLSKKIKLVIDSITAFTYAPVRAMVYVGFFVALMGFLYGAFIVTGYFHGTRVEGWSSIMVVMLFLGGVQMSMLGVLGEYTWRSLDESRARPRHIIESRTIDSPEGESIRRTVGSPDSKKVQEKLE